jgi:hypothetical protein
MIARAFFGLVLAAARASWGQATTGALDPAAAPPEQVVVRGVRPARDLGSEDTPAPAMRDVPGTFGDPFQAILTFPGVAAMASGLPYFYVRGAPPADTGYFLDGIPLPALFHIGPGPSVIPPALLERVDFFPSTAPARYGRFVGGVISGETRPPSAVTRGEASLRLFDASAFVETPLDARSTVLVAGRYGYPNLLLSLFAPHLSLSYGDYTVRVTRDLGGADAVSVLALGAYDTERDASQGLLPVDTLFHRVDVRYDHRWAGGSARVAATLGYDRTTAPLSLRTSQIVTETSDRLRIEVRQQVSSALLLSGGADASAMLDGVGSAGTGLEPRQLGGVYADVRYRAARQAEVLAGVRVDAYRSTAGTSVSVDPKLAVRLRVSPRVTWISTVGVAHQPPTLLLPVPGLRLDASGGLQTAYQFAEGVHLRLPWAMQATLTGFYVANRAMNDFVSDCGAFLINCSVVDRVDGSTYGLELLAERALSERLGGWLSYTLSRADRHIGQVPFLSPFDRTHVLSAVLRYDLGAGIETGLRFTYNTGRPDIPSFSFGGGAVSLATATGAVLQHRLPDFYRVDLRAAKRFALGDRAWLSAVLEFFDVTLNAEAVDFTCDLAKWVCTARTVGPIALPSIGVEGGF